MNSASQTITAGETSRCTHGTQQASRAVHLPVLPGSGGKAGESAGGIRKSKNARRRAIVLMLVQLLIIAHIVLWILSSKYGWFGGYTISPVEPSESMEFTKSGVINAGLIFFALALLSTLILGRWFCGWGCHVVMLQDFCGWLMKKCGVRPKPFRSRLLIYVPLILAVYMFIMPAAHRWGLVPLDAKMAEAWGDQNWAVQTMRASFTVIGFPLPIEQMPEWKVQSHLVTQDFWKTFAGVGVAIPFLFVCGFAVVYFLGAKGFCTYGCPYGGFFAPLDKLALARIFVTDACEGCGHCTAVCTSNVRVHEEVREYGMVVDPGCMKCLDCVSVCPNEALYFGFGKPAVLKGAAKNKEPKRSFDFTWGEEISFAGIFLAGFLAVRGVYGVVPMLMAVGLAGIVTYMAWKLWRIVRDPNVTIHRWQLKLKQHITAAGWGYIVLATAVLGLVLHSGAVNAAKWRADWLDRSIAVASGAPFSGRKDYLTPELSQRIESAIAANRFGSSIHDGGIGLLRTAQLDTDLKLLRLHVIKQDFAAVESLADRAMQHAGEIDPLINYRVLALYGQKRADAAVAYAREMLLKHEHMNETLDTYVQFCNAMNDSSCIVSICRERVARFPDDLRTLRWLSTVLLQSGSIEEGIALTRRTIELDPNHASARYVLAMALMEGGEVDEALQQMREARRLDRDSLPIVMQLVNMLEAAGKPNEAAEAREEALKLQQKHQERAAKRRSAEPPR